MKKFIVFTFDNIKETMESFGFGGYMHALRS